MKNTIKNKLALMLIIVMMISLASCDYFIRKDLPEIWQDATYVQDTELGEGSKTLVVRVEVEENSVTFTIHTDAETVGQALLDLGLIAGEESQYGLYIKQVNGMTADYDIDQTYWAFYINGEYGMTGVDTTPIFESEVYSLVRSR
jgi:outer membrane lipopolysaccharide assembly protein LptE/RlpB